jgi:hypothetical protein
VNAAGARGDRSAPGAKRRPRPSGWERRGQVLGVRKGRGLAQSAANATRRRGGRFPRTLRQNSTVSFRQRSSELPQNSRDLRVTGARLHLDSFQDSSCPAAAGLFDSYRLIVLEELVHSRSGTRRISPSGRASIFVADAHKIGSSQDTKLRAHRHSSGSRRVGKPTGSRLKT